MYREESTQQFTFSFNNRSEIQSTIDVSVEAKLKEAYARHFYYLKYVYQGSQQSECHMELYHNRNKHQHRIFYIWWCIGRTGDFATSNLKYAKVGALIKFTSPDTREFLNNTLVTAGTDNAEDRAWAKIGAVVLDGANGRCRKSRRRHRTNNDLTT